jgi:hypothetical protein
MPRKTKKMTSTEKIEYKMILIVFLIDLANRKQSIASY